MNKLIVIMMVLSSLLITGCRTVGPTQFPSYQYQPPAINEKAAHLEYQDQVLKWQQNQQKLDRTINDSRIKNRRKPWWQWW